MVQLCYLIVEIFVLFISQVYAIVIRDHSQFLTEITNMEDDFNEMYSEASEVLDDCWKKIGVIQDEVSEEETYVTHQYRLEFAMIKNNFMDKFAGLFEKDTVLQKKLLDAFWDKKIFLNIQMQHCLEKGKVQEVSLKSRGNDLEEKLENLKEDTINTVHNVKDQLEKLTSKGDPNDSFNLMANFIKQNVEDMRRFWQHDIPIFKFDVEEAENLREVIKKCFSPITYQVLRDLVKSLSEKYL